MADNFPVADPDVPPGTTIYYDKRGRKFAEVRIERAYDDPEHMHALLARAQWIHMHPADYADFLMFRIQRQRNESLN